MSQYRFDTIQSRLDAPRTLFRQPHTYKTTFNGGKLIPVYCREVLPGDSWSINLSAVVRELTLLNPVMDNSYIQFDCFFVKWVDIWDKAKQFFGENETGVWTETNDYEIPHGYMSLNDKSNTLSSCSLGDYFGQPVGVPNDDYLGVSYLQLRGYALIYNYYYLNEATQAPILFSKGQNITFDSRLEEGYESTPLSVNRFADLFTTCLPQPQKSPNIPFLSDYLPVVTRDNSQIALSGGVIPSDFTDNTLMGFMGVDGSVAEESGYVGNDPNGQLVVVPSSVNFENSSSLVPSNLYATTLGSSLRDINSFRIAAATQQFYEQLARGGSRYNEYIKGLFGVNVPANEIGVPTYLGSVKKLINVNQVLATADSSSAVLGTTGAYSHTAVNNEHICTGSFNQFGYIYILAHVRTDNTYSQGMPKMFSKRTKFDIFNPLFDRIGNVVVLNKEIKAIGNKESDDGVFGYAEAHYDYKYCPNVLTGYMRPGVDNSFSSWTYGRDFATVPVLNEQFTLQTADEIDRTIAVQSEISNQFKLDLFVDAKVSRTMSLYSEPGLTKI